MSHPDMLQPCPKCWRALIPYKDGKATVICFGPSYRMDPRISWLSGRYGKLEWSHITAELAVEFDVFNMNPDPEEVASTPRDVRVVNTVRTWLAWHLPHRRTQLPVAKTYTTGNLIDDD